MLRENVSLDDRYALSRGRVLLSGVQALVRLPLLQARFDRASGLDTAGFISGYRGSPLGGLDQALWQAGEYLNQVGVRFSPGVNEDLAATAVQGTQQVGLFPGARYDGVYAMWYGKAPGVDRSCDAIRHANAAGTASRGGVLAVAGDDHGCKSSTLASQSEFAFADMCVPVLSPCSVEEVLEFGLLGWSMSRYSGLWVGMIALAGTMDSTATVDVGGFPRILLPEEFELPPGGLNIRLPDSPLDQEERLHTWRLPAAQAFARANNLNRLMVPAPSARLGVIATGKAFVDVRQAMVELGLATDAEIAAAGIRLLKVGMPWPLDDRALREFAAGLDHILVVEEKRPLVEDQVRSLLYGTPGAAAITGKRDAVGSPQLPVAGELSPAKVARALAGLLPPSARNEGVQRYLNFLDERERALLEKPPQTSRQPMFCAGCPHSRSTPVPQGSRAMAGIGCHYMAQWIAPPTSTFSQMGGEGTAWIGQAPFTETDHIFANIGDGTWFHSGILAVRAAVAAKVNITYKILYNDAVAMTGGQSVDGSLAAADIVEQLVAEGVKRVEVVADDPGRHPGSRVAGRRVRHRDEMDVLQRELRETSGCTAIVYDQVCATELRRRRKRGKAPPATTRVLINEAVCEGCGDCSVQSRCVAVEPLATEDGHKRRINQSLCNSDLSCLRGFCPSFVTITGGAVRTPDVAVSKGASPFAGQIPEPVFAEMEAPVNLLITGVGGTGIVTVSQVVAMAAHLDHKAVVTLDMAGLAQKGGAVLSHVRIASSPEQLHASAVATGRTDLLLACDLVTASSSDALSLISPEQTVAVVNTDVAPTSDFVLHQTVEIGEAGMLEGLARHTGEFRRVNASGLARRLLGDAVAANMFLLGYGWQLGRLPVSLAALERAVELNGVAVDMNLSALQWGRLAAHAPEHPALWSDEDSGGAMDPPIAGSLADRITNRFEKLIAYQGPPLAEYYRRHLTATEKAEERAVSGSRRLTAAVADSLYRVLTPKDEYEVARLYSDGRFQRKLATEFTGGRIAVQLAPPLLAFLKDPDGRPRKLGFGNWIFWFFRLLAKMRRVRGSWFDPFRFSHDRRLERQLATDFESILEEVVAGLDADNLEAAVRLIKSIQEVRGFGPVRAENDALWREQLPELLADFRSPDAAFRIIDPKVA